MSVDVTDWVRFRQLQAEHGDLAERQRSPEDDERLWDIRSRIRTLFFQLIGPIEPTKDLSNITTRSRPDGVTEFHGDAESLAWGYRALLRKACAADPLALGFPSAVDEFLREARNIFPDFAHGLDGRTEYGALMNGLIVEMNAKVFFPRNTVLVPAVLSPGIELAFHEGTITGGWTEHRSASGASAWSTTVEWKGDGLPAMFVDRFAFIDVARRRAQSNEHFSKIMRGDTPFGSNLASILRHHGIDEHRYDAMLEAPRLLAEETQHAFDRMRVNAVKKGRRFATDDDAVAEVLLARDATHFRKFCVALNNPYQRCIGTTAVLEYAAQVGGLIRLMKREIERGNCGLAFAHFLNYAHIIESLRAPILAAGVLSFDDCSIERAYQFAAHRVLQDMPTERHAAHDIVAACYGQDQHPAITALSLLEASFARNISPE